MVKRKGSAKARPVQVGEQIRQCLGEMLLEGAVKDTTFVAAAAEASIVTVTEVRMTNDLRLARVLVSVFPDDEAVVLKVFEGLGSAKGEIKRELGQRLRLRFTPELRFLVDDSMAYGAKIEALLKEIEAEREGDEPERAPDDEGAEEP